MIIYDEVCQYVDGKLKGITYVAGKVLEIWEELEELNIELNGSVSSPTIKSTEEAKYQRSIPVYHSRVTELMYKEETLIEEFNRYEKELISIGDFLKRLDPDEVELLIYRYEMKMPVRMIARILYTNKDSIYRNLEEILKKW